LKPACPGSIDGGERWIMENKTVIGHLLALVTIFIWGTTYISTKILLTELTPVEILFYRFAIAYLALFLIYPKIEKIASLREELLFFCLGFTGICLYFLFQNMALQYSLASNVGLLVSVTPILTAIAVHFTTPDEKLNPRLLVGFLVAICGIFLVIFNGKFVLQLNPLGDILALLTAIVWAVYSVLLKKVAPDRNPVYVVRKTFFYGLLAIIPWLFLLKFEFKLGRGLGWPIIFNMLFLGLFASALCFVMWNRAIKIMGVIKASNYIYLVPLITMVTSVWVLREKVNAWMIFGGFLILAGVYIAERGLGKTQLLKNHVSSTEPHTSD
jgi:drug/metabolite transporter (DMT)-like permease